MNRPKVRLLQSWQMYKKGTILEPDAMTRSFLLSTRRAERVVDAPAPDASTAPSTVDDSPIVEQDEALVVDDDAPAPEPETPRVALEVEPRTASFRRKRRR